MPFFALDYGFMVHTVGVRPAESRTGQSLGGYTDYFVKEVQGISEQEMLFRRAVIAYAGAVTVGLVTRTDPVQVLARADDDRNSTTEFINRLREIGIPDDRSREWRLAAWNEAIRLAPLRLSTVKALADSLVGVDIKKCGTLVGSQNRIRHKTIHTMHLLKGIRLGLRSFRGQRRVRHSILKTSARRFLTYILLTELSRPLNYQTKIDHWEPNGSN